MKFSQDQLNSIESALYSASKAIIDVYEAKDFEAVLKEDKSPVTKADLLSHEIIVNMLKVTFPHEPILSEEDVVDWKVRQKWESFFILDPLDGTKEFMKKNGEFTINLAWVSEGIPQYGWTFVPVKKNLFFNDDQHVYKKTFFDDRDPSLRILNPVLKNIQKGSELKILSSRSHRDQELPQWYSSLMSDYRPHKVSVGSALKFCYLLESQADVYIRFSPCCEWDTASSDAMLRVLGRPILESTTGKPLRYNKENLLNPYFYVSFLELEHLHQFDTKS